MIKTKLTLLAWLLVASALPVMAIEPGEVREYGEVFAISAETVSEDRIEVTWTIADGYYLYNNKFLAFSSETPGVVLGEPEVPPGELKFDPLLGEEVIKFHGSMTVGLPLLSVPDSASLLSLKVRSQGCLEDVLCYPPTEQLLVVSLHAGSAVVINDAPKVAPLVEPVSAPTALNGVFSSDLKLGQDPVGKQAALAPEQAFQFEAIGLSAGTILVRFTAQPGYYLYVDKFAFRVLDAPGFEIREVVLPPGTIKDDPEFGPVPVIYDQVEIPVRLNRPAGPGQEITLQADYQGCRDGDICYPPQTTAVRLTLVASAEAINEPLADGATPDTANEAVPVSEQGRLASMLIENPDGAMLAFFLAGILLAFTPCVFPMVPILSGIIAGEGDRLTTMRAFWLSLVYVLAMAVTYTVAGVLAGLFGKNLQAAFQDPWIISGFVAIFILLALSMFGFYELQLPGRWQTALAERSNRQQGGRFGGVAVMGFLSALIVGPCVAPPLAAALIVIGSSGNPVLGGSALFAMSMGMGLPLILFGMSAGKLIPRAGAWMNAVKAVFGVGLLALSVWMLERILPGGVIMLLWGLLAIGSGVYLGALERVPDGASGFRRLWKALGVVLLLVGSLEIIGAASGGDYWLKPLGHLRQAGGAPTEAAHVEFKRIKSLDELSQAVALANADNRPAMLDFYADWCVECIRMERNTFPEPKVQALLNQLQPLQADVTANDTVDQALMAEFGIIGPPAILFFDRRGREMPAYRLVGYFKPDAFARHLQQVVQAR